MLKAISDKDNQFGTSLDL